MLYLDWRFFPVYDPVASVAAYGGVYNAGLVVLSVVVATLAAFVALSVSGRIVAANSRGAQWAWASAGALAMGGGIWSMHFIGMLAFTLPCGVTYSPVGTVLSMIPGILASGVALHAISQRTDLGFKRLAVGGVLMGAGIGLMHYSGMAAMEPQALLRYDPGLVALSVVVAVGLAFVSLSVRFRFRASALSRVGAAALAAPIMGFAVAGMHYTAMQASIFFPLAAAPLAHMPASPMYLAALITVFIVLIMAIALVATFAGRQVELAQSLAAEIAERKRTEAELIKARQQADAANRAKSQFLATMSHEIRTPLNGVVGTANLLAATPLNDRQTQLVHNLVRSGQALIGIINDILDLSKIEAGRFELAAVNFDPRELVAEVTDLFCERCTSKGLEFVYFVTEDVPRHLTGDPSRLRQVLINLVGNAVKFTEEGEILVEMSRGETTESDVTLHCSVIDTGIGIDPEHQARIFDSFQQVDASMTRSRGGTGLGLSIVKELVTIMGGDISVESEAGRGSRFRFTVRLGRSGDETGASAAQRVIERPLRVLVVDSNAVSAEIMSRYFDNWRLDAVICGSAAEAEKAWQEAASERPFDVAIIDVKGLRCDGMKLARKIRSKEQQNRPEVILLMGLDGSIADKKLESVGAFALLAKPARPSVLFDCLASIASGSRENGVASFYARKSGADSKVAFDARVLVVEDNAVNQDVATGFLKNMGCSVVTASNGQHAVQLFAQEMFDLILMDCEMPIMDGFDATKRIRDIERALSGLRGGEKSRSRTPIVALTAHALAEVRERCLEVGMDDFLVKPYDDAQIADMLGRWLTPRVPVTSPNIASSSVAEAPPAPAATATLDMGTIEKIRRIPSEHGSSLLRQVVSRFAANAGPLMADIRAKARNSDPEAMWRAAHSLRSSAASIGACRVAQSCAEIEALARENGILPTEAVLAALESELSAAMRELSQLAEAEPDMLGAESVVGN
jgi:signal transduction histidine kinase/DNA-binding response OmpR family regulator/HPt (histidine-containing phosphotransfer) domain-containing protein